MKIRQHTVGFLFGCTNGTIDECMDRRLFGSPPSTHASRLLGLIYHEAPLFLFNYSTRELIGCFAAVGGAQLNLVPEAFGGKFPVQVKFDIVGPTVRTLPESHFKDIIKDNYFSPKKFSNNLTKMQVNGLRKLFRSESRQYQLPKTERPITTLSIRRRVEKATTVPNRTLRDVLRLPPHLRPPVLFPRPDTIETIPFPPSDTDRRTTICFGPLPRSSLVPVESLLDLLNELIESKYDFLLVQTYNRERWCYVNFRVHQEVSYFVLDSQQKSLNELSGGRIPDRDRIEVFYWKWQGIDTLARIFSTSGCWLSKRLENCTQFYDNRPLFFNGAGAKEANRCYDQKLDDCLDVLLH